MTWFSEVLDKYQERGEAMYAFSVKQVEEHVPLEEFERDWVGYGSGLYVKSSVLKDFQRDVNEAFEADQAELPEVKVEPAGYRGFGEYPAFRVVEGGDVATKGQLLIDINLGKPGTAPELHVVTSDMEPSHALPARITYAELD